MPVTRLPFRELHGLEDAQGNFEWIETHWPSSVAGGDLGGTYPNPKLSVPYGCIGLAGAQGVANGATGTIGWDTTVVNSGIGTSPAGFTIQRAGAYRFDAYVVWTPTGSPAFNWRFDAHLQQNGGDKFDTIASPAGGYFANRLGGLLVCAVGDVIGIYISNGSGFNATVGIYGALWTYFTANYVSS
jgi:hypothetical protein